MNEASSPDVFDRLMAEIHHRAQHLPAGSYTTTLIQGGIARMGEKILEEAGEVVQAAYQSQSSENQPPENRQLIYEACDLIYHLWVLLGSRGISVEDLRRELGRREGRSGLEEKRSRRAPSNKSSGA